MSITEQKEKGVETMKSLQRVYNEIVNILKKNNVTLNLTPPRPFLERDNERLYFDQAWEYKNFDNTCLMVMIGITALIVDIRWIH